MKHNIKVLVCGGRDFNDRNLVFTKLDVIHKKYWIDTIIHGAAKGADSLGGEWARQNNVYEEAYPANWRKYGNSAGPIRNKQMLEEGKPDLVVAFPGGRGTDNMCQQSQMYDVIVVRIN